MKKPILIISAVTALLVATAFRPQQMEANAVAKKIQGVTAYVNAEPSKPYKVVFRYKVSFFNNLNSSLNEMLEAAVSDGIKKAEKKGVTYDAIIITGGEESLLIKYE